MNKHGRHPGESRGPKFKAWIPAFAGMTIVLSSLHVGASDAGSTGANFLKVPISARGTALAGALTAASGDAVALEYNPAGLAGLEQNDLTLSYISYFEDTSFQSAEAGVPIKGSFNDKLFFGLQYRAFKVDDELRSVSGVKIGEFQVKDQLAQLAVAYTPARQLSLGVAGKYIKSEIRDNSGSTFAGDVGVIWKPGPALSLGAAILNMGPELELIAEGDPLPLTGRVGLAYRSKRLLILADGSAGRDKVIQPAGGVEFDLNRFVSFRFGSFYNTDIQLTGGIGLRINPPAPEENIPFYQGKSGNTLENAGESSDNSMPFSSFQFGLDYGVRTQTELGVSHTITLKILY